jgi:lipopolysaccharide transport system permease protein
MLAVYTFVFSVIFKARWGGAADSSKTEFALILFAGLIVFNIFSECANRSPNIILSNVNLVKKVVFPLEILPWVNLGAALFHAVISTGIWLIFFMVTAGMPSPWIFLLPIALLPLILFTMGISWFLASFGVFLRDVGHLTSILTTVLMFLTPIFYPITAIPEKYRTFLELNPLAPAVEQMRNILYWRSGFDMHSWSTSLVLGFIVAWAGFAWFQKTKKSFADVI